jgi:hypothetical protein
VEGQLFSAAIERLAIQIGIAAKTTQSEIMDGALELV